MDVPDDKKRKLEEGQNGFGETSLATGGYIAGALSKDELKKLVDPLTKEQLVELLTNAGAQYVSVAEEINEVASKDPAHRKLFVRGLAWETTTQTLRDAFTAFGEIVEGAVITDKGTGKSKGFGFITFKSMDSAYKALREPSKRIDGRMSVCNLAAQGAAAAAPPSANDHALRKLYVGSLAYETTSEALLNFFSQYGEIEEGAVAYDKNTGKSRGFAFVTFKSLEGARKALAEPSKTIEGREVTVKVAAEGQREKQAGVTASPLFAAQQQQPQVVLPTYPNPYGVNPYAAAVPAYNPQAGAAAAAFGMAYGASAGMPTYASQPQYTPGLTSTPAYTATQGGVSLLQQQQYAAYAAQQQAQQQAQAQAQPQYTAGVSPMGMTPLTSAALQPSATVGITQPFYFPGATL